MAFALAVCTLNLGLRDNRSMKVLDLHCAHQHSFEGWFSSEDDFQSQLARGLVTCPMCGDANITKMLSAPRLNLSSARGEPESRSTPNVNADTTEHEQHAVEGRGDKLRVGAHNEDDRHAADAKAHLQES